jgi:hypothetical protein
MPARRQAGRVEAADGSGAVDEDSHASASSSRHSPTAGHHRRPPRPAPEPIVDITGAGNADALLEVPQDHVLHCVRDGVRRTASSRRVLRVPVRG